MSKFLSLITLLFLCLSGYSQDRTSPVSSSVSTAKVETISAAPKKDSGIIESGTSSTEVTKARVSVQMKKPERTEEMLERKKKAPLLSDPQ